MNRRTVFSILVASALVLVVGAGAFIYRTARAAAASRPAVYNWMSVLRQAKTGMGMGHGFGGGYTDQDLATALNISVADLQAAYEKANSAALDQAVKDGLITQAQADQLKSTGRAFPFDGRWNGWLSQNGIDFQALLAQALNITPEQLKAGETQAFNTRIDQAVTNGRLTQAQADLIKGRNALGADQNFQSAMQSAFEAAVRQAVSQGVITQAQADAILKDNSSQGGLSGFPGKVPFGGFFEQHEFRGPRGFNHMGGGWGGAPAQPSTPQTTPSTGL